MKKDKHEGNEARAFSGGKSKGVSGREGGGRGSAGTGIFKRGKEKGRRVLGVWVGGGRVR